MNPNPRRATRTLSAPILLVALAAGPIHADDPRVQGNLYDCGTIALHTMLMLEGRPVTVLELEETLPAVPKSGYSMAQLRDAARARGLELIGMKLSGKDGSLDRPALIHLARGEHGHFEVIRPVGHTGKLVQVFDTTGDPVVGDLADLRRSRDWSGLALVPARSAWPRRALIVGPIVAAAPIALLLARGTKRRRIDPRSGESPVTSV